MSQSQQLQLILTQYLRFMNHHITEVPVGALNQILENLVRDPSACEGRLEQTTIKGDSSRPAIFPLYRLPVKCDISPKDEKTGLRGGIITATTLGDVTQTTELNLKDIIDGAYKRNPVKTEKPEFVQSDYLKGTLPQVSLQAIPVQYKKTRSLFYFLMKEREWIAGQLRKVYVLIGEKQREFINTLDIGELHCYFVKNLAEDLGLHPSTVSRLIKNRYTEIQGSEKSHVLPTRILLTTKDDVFFYSIFGRINKIFEEEFKSKHALNDREIQEKVNSDLSRSVIAKYRSNSQVPDRRERQELYGLDLLAGPYKLRTRFDEWLDK